MRSHCKITLNIFLSCSVQKKNLGPAVWEQLATGFMFSTMAWFIYITINLTIILMFKNHSCFLCNRIMPGIQIFCSFDSAWVCNINKKHHCALLLVLIMIIIAESLKYTYMKPACVCTGLGQSAWTVNDLIQEVGKRLFQGVPLHTLVLGPGGRIISECLF